jgi:hypothetical protein
LVGEKTLREQYNRSPVAMDATGATSNMTVKKLNSVKNLDGNISSENFQSPPKTPPQPAIAYSVIESCVPTPAQSMVIINLFLTLVPNQIAHEDKSVAIRAVRKMLNHCSKLLEKKDNPELSSVS